MIDGKMYDEFGRLIQDEKSSTEKHITRNIGRKSALESTVRLYTYSDLTNAIMDIKTNRLKYGQNFEMEEGDKNFSPRVSRSIWISVIESTKPYISKNDYEDKVLARVYKILYKYTLEGEYPLLQQLCNYLGVGVQEFFAILRTPSHVDRNVYMWAFNVFESAAQYNAVKGNGNFNARQWIDRSVENKIAVEDRMELTIEAHKLDKLEEIGADLARELIGTQESEEPEVVEVEVVESE